MLQYILLDFLISRLTLRRRQIHLTHCEFHFYILFCMKFGKQHDTFHMCRNYYVNTIFQPRHSYGNTILVLFLHFFLFQFTQKYFNSFTHQALAFLFSLSLSNVPSVLFLSVECFFQVLANPLALFRQSFLLRPVPLSPQNNEQKLPF